MQTIRSSVACAALAIAALVAGPAAASGASHNALGVSVTVIRPATPVIKVVNARGQVVANAVRPSTAHHDNNGVHYVLVEY